MLMRFTKRLAALIGLLGLHLSVAPAAAQEIVSGNKYVVKTNATVEGCFRTSMRACQQVFGECKRQDAAIFRVEQRADVALTCQTIPIVEGDPIIMVVSYAATRELYPQLSANVARMVREINERYW